VANLLIAIKLLFIKKKKFNHDLVSILGYFPRNMALYELAFIHRSASVLLENGSSLNNERLEFLGDALLDAIVAEFLFESYPDKNEGFLSTMRSKIVKRKHLNNLAIKLGLEKLIVANSFNNNGGKHICGNAFEALIGAIYVDRGYNVTRKFIINKILKTRIDLEELEHTESDFKSRIIEWAQKNRTEIKFEIEEEYTGKDHAPIFISRIFVTDQLMGEGKGTSKKEAEQNAAEQAFSAISII
jgi:ribonuclease III